MGRLLGGLSVPPAAVALPAHGWPGARDGAQRLGGTQGKVLVSICKGSQGRDVAGYAGKRSCCPSPPIARGELAFGGSPERNAGDIGCGAGMGRGAAGTAREGVTGEGWRCPGRCPDEGRGLRKQGVGNRSTIMRKAREQRNPPPRVRASRRRDRIHPVFPGQPVFSAGHGVRLRHDAGAEQ